MTANGQTFSYSQSCRGPDQAYTPLPQRSSLGNRGLSMGIPLHFHNLPW